jgi:hypothetical protein
MELNHFETLRRCRDSETKRDELRQRLEFETSETIGPGWE